MRSKVQGQGVFARGRLPDHLAESGSCLPCILAARRHALPALKGICYAVLTSRIELERPQGGG